MNRIDDFIVFHNKSCTADSIVLPLKKYCELKEYSKRELEQVNIFYALTYCTASTIILMNKFDELKKNPEDFWKNNKNTLLFQSDRKYVKMNDMFVSAWQDFAEKHIFEQLDKQDVIDVEQAIKIVQGVKYFGRFSAFLFLECYCCLFDKACKNNKLDWQNGNTVTSGMFNVLGEDEKADLWDKEHKLKIDSELFDKYANDFLEQVELGKELAVLETNLCAYRKLFKKSRYIGYYSDRVLEESYQVFNNYPAYKSELKLLFKAREMVIAPEFLGEKNGWNGIRPELKKFYIQTGSWDWTKQVEILIINAGLFEV